MQVWFGVLCFVGALVVAKPLVPDTGSLGEHCGLHSDSHRATVSRFCSCVLLCRWCTLQRALAAEDLFFSIFFFSFWCFAETLTCGDAPVASVYFFRPGLCVIAKRCIVFFSLAPVVLALPAAPSGAVASTVVGWCTRASVTHTAALCWHFSFFLASENRPSRVQHDHSGRQRRHRNRQARV